MKSSPHFRRIQSNNWSLLLQQQKTIPRCHLARHATVPCLSRTSFTQSSSNSWLIFAISTGIVLSGTLYLQQASGISNKSETKVQPATFEDSALAKEYHGMVATKLPGRPGNLTKEEEGKLQELWIESFKVFGVGLLAEDGNVSETNAGPRLDATESDKKKKKRINMFGRKSRGENLDETPAGGSGGSGDSDDKFGLTKEFQQTLATMTPEEIREAFWGMVKHDNPDGLLLRFLRARKWDVQKALVMMIATLRWRFKDMRVDEDITKNGEAVAAAGCESSDNAVRKEAADFMAQLRIGKAFFHGVDKEGRPLCFVRVRLHKLGEQSEASLEKFTVHVIETARLLLVPNVDTAAVIFDMTDFSLANMDYGPVKFMIKVFEANYPECLGIVLVHRAPWIFQGIWTIIKGWLDPVVATKIHFTKTINELEHFIDRDHIIKDLGGEDPYTYHYIEPGPNENKLLADEETRNRLLDERATVVRDFENTTQEWIQESRNTGRQQNSTLQDRRHELAERLRTGYWQLDPYIRAKTHYDRIGMIKEGGKIQFYGTDPPSNSD